MADPPGESVASGNTEEDWNVFEVLCKDINMEDPDVDLTTSLRSEIAALQYKRDRLQNEVEEMRSQVRSRDQHCLQLQAEADQLREQAARQGAIIASLKKRVHELEDRERSLLAAQERHEISMQSALRDVRYSEEKAKEFESKVRTLEINLNAEEQKKESARINLQDIVRRLSVALGAEVTEFTHVTSESLVFKATELVQETSRLKTKTASLSDQISSLEMELRTCKETLERTLADKEYLQRQSANQILDIDRLRQEKDALEMQQRVAERELAELRDKLAVSNRSLGSASGNIAQQEALICQIRDELKIKEEKLQRFQAEHKHTLESIAILLSTPTRYTDSVEGSIKERIHEILEENKEKSAQIETLRHKLDTENQQLSRQISTYDQAISRIRLLEEEKSHLEVRLQKAEAEFAGCEMSRDGLKRDKATFVNFLDRLARALNMDEISRDIGVELHTESLLLRAEQLARLESEKLVDKTALVYQLQRRVRNLREQLQRKELHLDLLRRKLNIQDDTVKTKNILQSDLEEANMRIKKLVKQVDRYQIQLAEAKSQIRDLNSQLADAADYKITALERGRKIEELQKRLIESETLRTKYNRKVSLLKDQVRATGGTIEQERSISEHSIQLLKDELTRVKDALAEVQRRENQLQSFKHSVAKILGVLLPMPDYELVSRLQKLVDAHHDFTLVSRRYDDPALRLTSRSPTLGIASGGGRLTRTPDRSRYDDSGYVDATAIDDIDDDIFKKPL